jgi:hypothetical protein
MWLINSDAPLGQCESLLLSAAVSGRGGFIREHACIWSYQPIGHSGQSVGGSHPQLWRLLFQVLGRCL